MPATPQHTSWSAIPIETMNPLLTRQFVTGNEAMLARIVLQQGCLVPRHAHTNEQITFVLSGALRFLLGHDEASAQEVIVRSGELLVIPANLPHSAEALEDTIDLDIFSPPRQDWIDNDDSYLR